MHLYLPNILLITQMFYFYFQEQYMSGLPSIVFGLVALGPACLALVLPDTSRVPLPDHVEQAEHLDQLTVEDEEAPEAVVTEKEWGIYA